jgi:hypothetical protein
MAVKKEITIVVCDKCKKAMDKDTLIRSGGWLKPTLVYCKLGVSMKGRKPRFLEESRTRFDFCPDCVDKFYEWLNNAEQEGGEG